MNAHQDYLQLLTRRHFFARCGVGLGSIALASLMDDRLAAAPAAVGPANPFAPQGPALHAQGPQRHLSVHGRRAQPA